MTKILSVGTTNILWQSIFR